MYSWETYRLWEMEDLSCCWDNTVYSQVYGTMNMFYSRRFLKHLKPIIGVDS